VALGQQHLNQVFRRAVAKQLAFVLFVKRDVVLVHERHKVLRREARQGAAAKLWVVAQKVLVRRTHIQLAVGEVAAATAGDANFLGHLLAVVQHQNLQALLCCHAGAK
jgi:hypothetical protein